MQTDRSPVLRACTSPTSRSWAHAGHRTIRRSWISRSSPVRMDRTARPVQSSRHRCCGHPMSMSATASCRCCSGWISTSPTARSSRCSEPTAPESRRSSRPSAGSPPRAGSVTLDGETITKQSAEQIVRSGIALMPGGTGGLPDGVGGRPPAPRLLDVPLRHRTDRGVDGGGLPVVPGPLHRTTRLAGDLSGGEQQQLALAMTLLPRPSPADRRVVARACHR